MDNLKIKKSILDDCKQNEKVFIKCMLKEDDNVIRCQEYKFIFEECIDNKKKNGK
tara:strand:+ start:477 stop:641 length:165 start_codon:yes stop_codon:yes gene_type:complete